MQDMGDTPSTTIPANSDKHAKPSYLDRLKVYVDPVLSWDGFLEALPKAEAEGILISTPERSWSNQDARNILEDVDNGILIIQNISINLVAIFGDKYDIDLDFFPQYFYRANDHTALKQLEHFIKIDPSRGWHLDCMTGARLSVQAPERSTEFWPWIPLIGFDSSRTRISFYTLTSDFYLFLIDGPRLSSNHFCLENVATPADLCRAMPTIPKWHLHTIDECSLLHRMHVYYRHSWNQELLRYCSAELLKRTATPTIILNVFCWHLRAHFLDNTVRLVAMNVSALSHHAVNEPNLDSLTRLNDCRRMLQLLREKLSDRPLGLSDDIVDWEAEALFNIGSISGRSRHDEFESKNVVEKHKDLNRRVGDLLASVTESFQLLIGAISVIDSDINKEQAERSTMLTVMAAIYLPLSLGTGIFGMNVKEVNGDGSNPHWWAVVIAIAIISFPSVLFVVYIFTKGRIRAWRSSRKLIDLEA